MRFTDRARPALLTDLRDDPRDPGVVGERRMDRLLEGGPGGRLHHRRVLAVGLKGETLDPAAVALARWADDDARAAHASEAWSWGTDRPTRRCGTMDGSDIGPSES